MKCSHWMKTAAMVALACALTARPVAAAGEKSPLAWVPATSAVVVHLNGLEEVRDHVVAFLKNAAPDRVDLVEKRSQEFLENGAQGRKLRGLAKDGPIFVVLMELPKAGDPPTNMAIIAAVTSYADFRDNALSEKEKKGLKPGDGYESTVGDGGEIFFVDKKDYVVVTPRKEVAEAFTKTAAGLDGKLSKAQAAKLLSSDLGVYVDMAAVNKEYGEHIKAAHKLVDEQLQKVEDAAGKTQKAQFALVKKFIGPLFQAIEDTQAAMYTLEIRPGGVALHKEAKMQAGSPTADFFKGFKASGFKEMGKLPAGQVFYSGMKIDPALLKFAGSMMTGLTADPDSASAKALTEAFEELSKAGPSEALGGITYPIAGLQITQCADPEKALAAQIKMLQSMGAEGGFQNVSFKEKPEVKLKAEKYKDMEFASVHMVWDLEKSLSAAGSGQQLPEKTRKEMAEAMKKLMGESMNIWIATDGKVLLQVMAKDWESAEKTLDQYYKGDGAVGEDKAFAAARKEMPKEATVLILVDAVQYVGVILDFAKPIIESTGAALPPNFPKAVKGKPGFIGVALTLQADHPSADLFISAEAVNQVYKGYILPLLPKGD